MISLGLVVLASIELIANDVLSCQLSSCQDVGHHGMRLLPNLLLPNLLFGLCFFNQAVAVRHDVEAASVLREELCSELLVQLHAGLALFEDLGSLWQLEWCGLALLLLLLPLR